MKFNVIGNILDSSGYAVHTRQLANALGKIADVKLVCQIQAGQEGQLTDKEVEMLKKPEDGINIIITHPLHWKNNIRKGRNWAFLVWEGDKVPDCFIEQCMNPDIEYILVPSQHTKEAVAKTLFPNYPLEAKETVDNKIKIIPHGVDLNKFYPKEKPKIFTFVCNKGFRNVEDRGGIQYAIRAYFEEFTKTDNVEMQIKINPVYGMPDIVKIVNELKVNEDNAILKINTSQLPYDDLVNLYNSGHVFVAPTRAEAFNMPCIEAMACGLPVITTNFGGQSEYVNDENGWIINGELKEVEHELEYEGIKWLTPSIKELRKAMREAYFSYSNLDNPNHVTIKKKDYPSKVDLSLIVAREWTWDNSAKKLLDLV